MWGSGTGSEVMRRIAAPMVGGMVTAPLLSMFVIPAVFLLMRRRKLGAAEAGSLPDPHWAGGEPRLSDSNV
jgi:Cu(I)/Ag(I) efflux system membrane protein CusA/SilA